MLENYCRPLYQKILVNPIAVRIQTTISPNKLTLLATIIGAAVLPLLLAKQPVLAVLAMLISGYLDTLDGTVARLHQTHNAKGAMLDIVSDRIVETAIILGLFAVAPTERAWWCLAMLGSVLICVTTFLVVGIFTNNDSTKSFHYSPGMMERAEAFIFFILMMLLPAWFSFLAGLFCGLVLLTAVLRIKEFLQYA